MPWWWSGSVVGIAEIAKVQVNAFDIASWQWKTGILIEAAAMPLPIAVPVQTLKSFFGASFLWVIWVAPSAAPIQQFNCFSIIGFLGKIF